MEGFNGSVGILIHDVARSPITSSSSVRPSPPSTANSALTERREQPVQNLTCQLFSDCPSRREDVWLRKARTQHYLAIALVFLEHHDFIKTNAIPTTKAYGPFFTHKSQFAHF